MMNMQLLVSPLHLSPQYPQALVNTHTWALRSMIECVLLFETSDAESQCNFLVNTNG